MSQRIIIIGAGVAGLTLARELADQYKILVLEGSDRIGGRVSSVQPPGFTEPVESGAEFIHGKDTLVKRLADRAGLEIEKADGKILRRNSGEWIEQEEMIAGWDELLQKMKTGAQDQTLNEFLNENYPGGKYDEFRRQVTAYAQGFDVADTRYASIKSLYQEWSTQELDNYRVKGGFSLLIAHLYDQCKRKGVVFKMNHLVKQIDWEENEVTVYSNDEIFDAEAAVITIPFGVLKFHNAFASINFTPPVDLFTNAARTAGFGNVVKVICEFKKQLWPGETSFMLTDEIFPTWWTQYPSQRLLLTGWAGGPKADLMKDDSREVVQEKAILAMSSIFNTSPEEIKDQLITMEVFNWAQHPFSLGAYSYGTIEGNKNRNVFSKDVSGTLYFAGEGIYEGKYPGTVEAAMINALDVASRIKAGIKIHS